MKIDIVNFESIDREYDDRHGGVRYFWIRYPYFSFLVYKEYPSFWVGDAIDTLADYAAENARGIMGSVDGTEIEYVCSLRDDAIADGRESEEYIEDFYMRAGNCGDYIEIPAMIEEISEKELIEKFRKEGYTATIKGGIFSTEGEDE